jgi:phosphate acetyltransferase
MSILIGKTAKVGYFRPIIEDFDDGKLDNHIETVISHFGLDIAFDDAYAITKSKLIKKKNKGKIGEVLDLIIEKYKRRNSLILYWLKEQVLVVKALLSNSI